MEIKVDIPEIGAEDRDRSVHIFLGIEQRVRKLFPNSKWEVKTVSCDGCGECCKQVGNEWIHGVDPETGWCKYLRYSEGHHTDIFKGWLCSPPATRPFDCSIGDMAGEDYCSVRWEEVDGRL